MRYVIFFKGDYEGKLEKQLMVKNCNHEGNSTTSSTNKMANGYFKKESSLLKTPSRTKNSE